MNRLNVPEFRKDLDAMGEPRVREKLAHGLFTAVQRKCVESWLAEKEIARDVAHKHKALFWQRFASFSGFVGVVIAAFAWYARTHS